MILKFGALNALSLVAIQGANALFPIFIFPFLLAMLGEDAFANLVVAEAMAFYVLTVCLYSFDTSGVQQIIEIRKEGVQSKEAACLFNIICARFLLFSVASVVLLVFNFIVHVAPMSVLLVWMLFALGMLLQSNFYFQAIESNFPLAVCIAISRLGAMAAIYFLVRDETGLLLASMILAGSFFVSGVAAFILLIAKFGFSSFGLISRKEIIAQVAGGRHIFLGNLSVALFRGVNVLILSGLSSAAAVAVYSIAEKVIKSIQALARPLNQVFAPKAIKAWSLLDKEGRSSRVALSLIWRSTRVQVILMLVSLPMIVAAIFMAHNLQLLPGFSGEAVFLIALMAPAIIFGVANAMLGAIGLSLIGAQSYFAKSVFVVGASTFVISMLISYAYGAIGAGIAFVIAELLLMIAFVMRYRVG